MDITVDIIAVTGLAGHAFGSWKSKSKPDMWLRDFLPKSISNARILTYGYDTMLYGSQSETSILELSRRLLESIKTIRPKNMRTRPLIFIAHSFGGLVVKEALVQASEGSEEDQTVYRSCYSLLFFGVPNRGLDNRSLMSMVKGQPNESLVRDLSESSRFLSLLHERFNDCFSFADSKIICVNETKYTRTVEWCPDTGTWERTGPKVMMVGHTSATNTSRTEKIYDRLSIDADHSELVKFGDISNPDYSIIESRIRNLVDNAPSVIKERFDHHSNKITQLQRQYIQNLKAPDYEAFRKYKVGDRIPGTLDWFLNNDLYQSWKSTDAASGLWIQGSPGQGKTMLAKYILESLEASTSKPRTTVLYFFFYDQDDSYRTASAALRSFIKQLLLLVPDAFQVISQRVDIGASTINDISLWEVLRELFQASIFTTIYCVIDGLDECQNDESRQTLLDFINNLIISSSARQKNSIPILKVLLTSRPTIDLHGDLNQFPSIHLRANSDDLKAFINGKVQALKFHQRIKQRAIQLLGSRVGQTFLWISIVLKRLKTATTLLSEAGMEQIINESPSDLERLFESIINQIKQTNDIAAQKLLIWAVFGRRPLHQDELKEAIAIQDDSINIKPIEKHLIDLNENVIASAAGVILEMIDEKVYLIHQSVKDFLLESEHLAEFEFCMGLHPSLYLARICMTYLCFTEFVETGPCQDSELLHERYRRHPFFRYAARNWHRHIGLKDEISMLIKIISQLTEPKSLALLAWGEAAGVSNLEEAKNTWDIAVKASIPWLAKLQINSTVVTEEIVKKAVEGSTTGYSYLRTLVNQSNICFTERALCVAAEYLDHELFRQLLQKEARTVITSDLIEAAARNVKHGRFVVELLLESENNFMVTAGFVKLAQQNHASGRDIIVWIISNDKFVISEHALGEIATGRDTKIMELLLNSRESIQGIELALERAVKTRDRRMVMLLLEKRGEDLQITEEYVKGLMEHIMPEEMKILLRKQNQRIQITEDMVIQAAMREEKREELLLLFLQVRGQDFQITEEVIKAIVSTEDEKNEIITFLLQKRGREITMTDEFWKAAAANRRSGGQTMGFLLRVRGRGFKFQMTEEIMKEIIWNPSGERILQFLLQQNNDLIQRDRNYNLQITDEIMKEIVRNPKGEGLLRVVFGLEGYIIRKDRHHKFHNAGDIGKETTGGSMSRKIGPHDDFSIQENGIFKGRITEEITKEVVKNPNGRKMMKLLFAARGHEIQITEEILKEAARNPRGRKIVQLLFKVRRRYFQITKEIMKEAARNPKGRAIMHSFSKAKGYDTHVTGEVTEISKRCWLDDPYLYDSDSSSYDEMSDEYYDEMSYETSCNISHKMDGMSDGYSSEHSDEMPPRMSHKRSDGLSDEASDEARLEADSRATEER
ncbi:hypothetical protein V8C37DRAFT_397655 [Trichoderma ceciliae]